jgi:hypothetical protein
MDWKESNLFALLRSLCELFVGELENKLTGTQKIKNVDYKMRGTLCDRLYLAIIGTACFCLLIPQSTSPVGDAQQWLW